jgi:AmmeMemoRadiSam system protein B/AmmeMemoRadiSam system protein A
MATVPIAAIPSRECGTRTEGRVKSSSVFKVILAMALLFVAIAACTEAPTTVGNPTPSVGLAAAELTATMAPGMVRKPAVAGTFYPEDPEELGNMVDAFLAPVQSVDGKPIGLIVPHAGYAYSGWVAAYGFKQLAGVDYDTIVIIGPNHQDPTFRDISVYARGAFETPLGLVPVDEEVAQALIDADEHIVFHPEVHTQEHSVEVELPFLQRLYESPRIVPIAVGQPTEENVEVLSQALVRVLHGKRVLLIASSDMSHYPAYDDAVRVDTATLAAIETGDPERVLAAIEDSMSSGVAELATCLCGEGPVLAVMKAAAELGANQVTVLQYANSADSPLIEADRSRVVGYGAVMLWRYEPPELDADERTRLLAVARESIAQYLKDGTLPPLDETEPDLLRKSGAFVTLEIGGELRGCIGHILAQDSLVSTVQQTAVSAATQDPRFPPLTAEELEKITVEISVLSPLRRVTNVDEIQVGTHGLFIVADGGRGLLLPQVATDEGWTRDQFLSAVCTKAGLPEDAWRSSGTALYTFTAIVFGEAP